MKKGCPLTQNGCIRIFSHTAYPNAVPALQIAERLAQATAQEAHVFWPESIYWKPQRLAWDRLLSSRQVTDAYLLALAVEHGGRFVTLDQHLPVAAVHNAEAKHWVVLS